MQVLVYFVDCRSNDNLISEPLQCYFGLLHLSGTTLVPAFLPLEGIEKLPRAGPSGAARWEKVVLANGTSLLVVGHLLCWSCPAAHSFRGRKRVSCLVEFPFADNPWSSGISWWRKGDSGSSEKVHTFSHHLLLVGLLIHAFCQCYLVYLVLLVRSSLIWENEPILAAFCCWLGGWEHWSWVTFLWIVI